ncbi:MAG: acylphosphatase [Nitriliruptorales bacterium]|nr:acylphosphatase [Nitriliruptorales bacterium]
MRRVHLTASGLVQGVFFRASARDQARRLGLTGWVRNTSQGTVEAEVQGDGDAVGRFIEFCRAGPGHAEVEHLTVDEQPVAENETGFSVR